MSKTVLAQPLGRFKLPVTDLARISLFSRMGNLMSLQSAGIWVNTPTSPTKEVYPWTANKSAMKRITNGLVGKHKNIHCNYVVI